MAILGDIRKQTWLLVVVIGVAMLAFVAGDLFSENSVVKRIFTGDPNEVGNINGESISVAEFINAQSIASSNQNNLSQNQVSQQVWNNLITKKIILAQAEKAGLEVSDDEVWSFMAKQYGMVDAAELKTQIGQLKSQAEQGIQGTGQAYQNFIMMFEEAKPNILRQKYMELVTMGVATTSKEAEFQQVANIQNATIDYAFASYDDLKKKYKVEITDDEINAYVKKYPKFYESEATVDLSYVYFPATPSAEDDQNALNDIKKYLTGTVVVDKVNNINDTIPSFASASNDSIYVSKYSDRPFVGQFITRKEIQQYAAQLPADYVDFLTTGSVGQVGGPFKTGNAYQLVKISKSKEIADSISSSHILISYKGTGNETVTRTRDEAKVLADSIVAQANAGNFTALVNQYSEDPGSKVKNGSIGWTSRSAQNIAPEYLQFLNTHKTGEIGLTESRFGFHIIKIDGVKNTTGYQFANIIKDITPSQATSDKNFSDARTFAQDVQGKSLNDFANLAQKKGFNYNTAENVTRYYTQPLVDPSTGFSNEKDNDILRWAFNKDTKPGSSFLFTTTNEDQIIVHLNAKTSKGLASAKSVRKEVEPILIHQKLVEEVNKKLGASPSLDAFASNFGAVKGNSSITFGSAQIAGKGAEPNVAGAAFGLKPGSVSKAIKGNTGVYVIQVKTVAEAPKVEDATFLVDQIEQQTKQKLTQQLIPSIIMSSDITDSRMEKLDRQQM
ncbi:peptidylprolyl isomerase [Moheibacter lacus]|uniref:Periplasmic chaperone PpiD n=1 Tax=Moheibacter lacus TaxID=2745851 RepID=A0A838ZGZ0_9FLAO|nr:peptidylprolyl isomerase [Moheibacter lacus]MBA5628951.1 peptidylprolyl isomerase [Moheibacter lacus]